MTREEFLSTLQKTLQGKISGDKVQDNINYYRDYIIEEMKKGKSEEEVFRGLGDPSLLAKTIITAEEAKKQQKDNGYDTGDYRHAAREGAEFQERKAQGNGRNFWKRLLIVLAVIMVIVLIVTIISGVVRILAPLVLPILLIVLVVQIFKRR